MPVRDLKWAIEAQAPEILREFCVELERGVDPERLKGDVEHWLSLQHDWREISEAVKV